jgi:hypothetical protein
VLKGVFFKSIDLLQNSNLHLLTITDIVIDNPPSTTEFQPILCLVSQIGSSPVTELSFELAFRWLDYLNQVPWACLWDAVEEHCAQLEKLTILLQSYSSNLTSAEKEKVEAIVHKGCSGGTEQKLEVGFLENLF